jgi:ABC-2 type transport system permease protein
VSALTGTGTLLRLAVRRDRVMLPAWLYILAVSVLGTAYSFKKTYVTAASRQHLAQVSNHTATLLATNGPVPGTSVGGLTAWKFGIAGAALAAIMTIFIVIRHTRGDEEEGRLELIRATRTGRAAPLTAALAEAGIASLALGVLVAGALIAMSQPVSGSVDFGLSLAGTGLVFAAIAACAAQLSENARTCRGLALSVLGASYLLRAAGDAAGPGGPRWLSWLSPLGWAEKLQPFGTQHWWLLAPMAALAGAAAAAAYVLSARRDLGAGLVPQRPGPARADAALDGPLGLAWRLQRGPLLAWAVSFAIAGAVLGSVARGIDGLLGGAGNVRHALQEMGRQHALSNAYLAEMMGTLGLIAAIYAVQAALRLRSEETGQRAEPVLATAVGRIRWSAAHLVIAVAGTAVILTAAGLGAGLAYGVAAHDVGGQLAAELGAALAQLPAALVIGSIAALLFGAAPRLATLSWAAVVVAALLSLLGPLLRLNQWIMDVSPFTHVPALPGGQLTAAPMIWLSAIAVLLAAAGLAALRRRDIG